MEDISFEKVISNDYKVFVDTSSLLQDNSEYIFFKIIAPLLCLHKKQIIIPKSVYNEIYKHSLSGKVKNIKSGVKILRDFEQNKLYVVENTFNEQFADNAIISLFSKLRLKYNLCLITNDNSHKKSGNLSQDILDLKNARSVNRIKDIVVFYLSRKDKNIVQFKDNNRSSDTCNEKKYTKSSYRQKVAPFSLPKSVKNGECKTSVSIIPEVNDCVFDSKNKKYYLREQIGRAGGEGSVYITSKKGYVCKIYKLDKNTNFKQEKITLLTKNKINVKGVCLPEFIAFNSNKEFIGYFMKKADGVEIKTSIFVPPLLKKKFPDWRRLHLATVAMGILKTVEALHKYNVILGDINPNNILIKDEHNIYFIDTDSFQIEDYPCSVGMIPYTKIENHGKKYSEYLRSKNDDIFAIMTLIFQILMPGKLPYSFSGGGSERENMKPENFPYRCYDGGGYDKAPDGQWVYIWSHLPQKLKKLFCKLFKSGETIQLCEAVEHIETYIYQLKKGHQTDLIFPSSFKQIDLDGHVVNEETSEHECKSCGANYFLTNSEKLFFEEKGWDIPIRCKPCQKNKKERNHSNQTKTRSALTSRSSESTSKKTNSSDLFSFLESLF